MAKASILVVDDESDVRELLSAILAKHGYIVDEADSGESALKALDQQKFDLVLLDLAMPHMSGVELLARLRSKHPMESLPVIVLTGHAGGDGAAHALEIGANELLVKPISMSIILDRVEAELSRRAARAQQCETEARHTLNAIPDLIFRAEANGDVLDASCGARAVGDWVSHIIPGTTLVDKLPSPLEAAFFEFAASRKTDGQVECLRCIVPRPNDEPLVYELRLVACSSCETVCIVRDVTEQAKYEHDLLRLARTDSLTQIPNRRQFEETLQEEWKRAQRHKSHLALVLLDVDFFKAYNDSLGHPAGDECLRTVARTIAKALLRPGDFLARYGGEEFSVLVPNTDVRGAERVAERIRKAIAELAFPHPAAPLGYLTISLGVSACLPSPSLEVETLLHLADEALYEAKKTGRNKVMCRDYSDMVFDGQS